MIAVLLITPTVGAFSITEPHDRDAMWVEPLWSNFTTASTIVGDRFNITVAMNFTEDVFNYQVALLYNRSQLECTNGGFTAGAKSEYFSPHGTTTGFIIDTSFLGNGSILATETCSAPDFIPGNHSGTLIWGEFKILQGVNITYPLMSSLFDISSNYASGGAGNTFVARSSILFWDFTPSDGNYNYEWALPTSHPKMGIEHDDGWGVAISNPALGQFATWPIAWGPNPPYANITSGFTASFYIENLAAGWALSNVTFTLSWNSSVIDILGAGNITIDANWLGPGNSITYAGPGTGTLTIYAENYSPPPPSSKVLVGTGNFTVMTQSSVPPKPSGFYDGSFLTYSGEVFMGPTGVITHTLADEGEARVYGIVALALPYLKVVPASTIIGPAPSIGTTFDVKVQVVNASEFWFITIVQFRLTYNSAIIVPVNVVEGPFMLDPQWDLHNTFFFSVDNPGDPIFGDHVAVIDMLLPNGTGVYDQTIFPNTIEDPAADPTVATITFKVIAQNCFGGANIVTPLTIPPFWLPTDEIFLDKNFDYIVSANCTGGTVTIKALNAVGRVIDLYGGAVNDGYGVLVGAPYLQFPAPFGGQGPNHYMDIVFPQSWVYLNANVTYNYWPVQRKDVGFEIEGPYDHVGNNYVPKASYQVWAKFTATTDSNGIATYAYRMPWPCDDPDSITGVWKITATVTIADQVVNDTMLFYYQRLVYITSVTTDSFSYYHDQYVKVTVDYQTHSVEEYPALFAVVIQDELGVPFGMALYSTKVGGAIFCTWNPGEFDVNIFIPKWAYAGNGYVHVSVYDKDPTIGGEALAPEYTPAPMINIYPYNVPLSVVIDWATEPIYPTLSAAANGTVSLTATASGGYPWILPGGIPAYQYNWYVNSTSVLNETHVTTSTFVFKAGVGNYLPGIYHVVVAATDSLGNVETIDIYVTVNA
jgi:hypothetical protein